MGRKECPVCNGKIEGRTVEALGQTFHATCFRCVVCRKDLMGVKFTFSDKRLYCYEDFIREFAPNCARCGRPIRQRLVVALGKKWHAEHFKCSKCNTELGGELFVERADKPYCETCYHKLFSPKCAKCLVPIIETAVIAMDQHFHPECFRCGVCGKIIAKKEFSVIKNAAICLECAKNIHL